MELHKSADLAELNELANHGDSIDQSLAEIHALVDIDDFAGVEKLVAELPALVEVVPVASREAALLKIQACLQGIQARAASRSKEISSRLDGLRNGRIATSAYQASEKISDTR